MTSAPPDHCARCGGSRMTPKTAFWVPGTYGPRVSFKDPQAGVFLRRLDVEANLARVCRDCGFVDLYVAPDALAELNEKWERLELDHR